jgi:hypothetical protein
MRERADVSRITKDVSWSADLAYAIGLLATDGNLSKIPNKLTFVSADKEQVVNLKNILRLKNKIGRHISGTTKNKAFRIQFSSASFYNFLFEIGLMPNKSKIIGPMMIPDQFFADFVRGYFDGDGCSYSYWDSRWKSSFMFYIELASASKRHISWLQRKITRFFLVKGRITKSANNSCYRLKFAKHESIELVRKMYYADNVVALNRKRLKIKRALAIINRQ